MTAPTDVAAPAHPGVRYPPPLLFVAAFGAGLLLHRVAALPFPGAGPAPLPLLAWVLVALGLAILAWAMATFLRARTAILPHHPAARLVIRGPYRWSRNPMYVGLTSVYLGLTLWVGSLWPLLLLPLVLLVLWKTVISREERYLAHAFGPAYEQYRATVRRWI